MLGRAVRHAAFWIPFAVTTYLAFAPNPKIVPPSISDVAQHIAAFVYLTIACWHVYYGETNGRAPALWMASYGVAIECVQAFEPTRFLSTAMRASTSSVNQGSRSVGSPVLASASVSSRSSEGRAPATAAETRQAARRPRPTASP